jgi:hypothetical protein
MKGATAMDRRRFLLLGGVGAVGGALLGAPHVPWLRSILQDGEGSLHGRLAALFHHQASARAIGRTYLQQHPLETTVRHLLVGIDDRLRTAGDRELIFALQQRIRQDFVEERVVKLEGWILSVTEARLCALTALA